MKKQVEIARLLEVGKQEADAFIRKINARLPYRKSTSQIAYVLRKLPSERRSFEAVVSALGGEPEATDSGGSGSQRESAPSTPKETLRKPAHKVRRRALRRTEVPEAAPQRQVRKPNWTEFAAILKAHHISCLYHFTAKSNLPSIRQQGGLFSWYYCERHEIGISCPGGNDLSRRLDLRHNLHDYVHLHFNDNPPMLAVARHIKAPVMLRVDPEVVYWATTKFSDVNATDSIATIGCDLESFQNICFEIATDRCWEGETEKKLRQAEVMVKTHIPLSYIKFPGGF